MGYLNWVAGILAAATLANAGVIKIPLKARASSGYNVPVTDWFNRTDNQWYATISVGTPGQELSVLWDTGSTALLLPRSTCTTCANKTLFETTKSTTFSPLPGTRQNALFSTGADSIPFTVPEGASGLLVHDTISLGPLTAPAVEFLLCDKYADVLDVMPIDGIMGMGPQRGQTGANAPWYWRLYAAGMLDSPVFSFYTPAGGLQGGQLTLGGIDETKYRGEIVYTDCQGGGFSFDVAQSAIYIGTSKGLKAFDNVEAKGYAILDTGTAFMQTPNYKVAKELYAQISGKITQIDAAGAWGAECEVLDAVAPELTFSLGPVGSQVNVTIPKAGFNLGEYPGKTGICQAVFNNPLSDFGAWLVGSPLLKEYYTVWDGVNMTIGWASLK